VVQLAASALNAADALVLTAPDKWQWSVSDTSSVGLTSNGQAADAHGLRGGTAIVTATETESGKSGQQTLSILSGCAVAGTGLATSAWPKYGGDNRNTGLGKGSGATAKIKWHALSGIAFEPSPAIGPDGTLYIGTADRNDHALYALLGSTGATKWRFQTGSFVLNTPAVDASGLIYFGSDDGNFYVVDSALGTSCTSLRLGGMLRSSAAIGQDGTVYVGGSRPTNKMFALDAKTHAIKWEFQLTDGINSAIAVGPDGTVYFGDGAGVVSALNGATGAKKWQDNQIAGGISSSSPTLGADGTLYISNGGLVLAARDSGTGAIKWTGGGEYFSNVALGPGALGYFNGSSIDGKEEPNTLNAFNPVDGTIMWTFTTTTDSLGNENSVWTPVVGPDGTVYVGTSNGTVYALDGVSGAVKWQIMTAPMALNSQVVIDTDGTVYVPTLDGVFAIQ
jgi:outer membrane protein assembly factor BamB